MLGVIILSVAIRPIRLGVIILSVAIRPIRLVFIIRSVAIKLIMLIIFMLSVIMLRVSKLCVVVQNVIFPSVFYDECHYYACCQTESNYSDSVMLMPVC